MRGKASAARAGAPSSSPPGRRGAPAPARPGEPLRGREPGPEALDPALVVREGALAFGVRATGRTKSASDGGGWVPGRRRAGRAPKPSGASARASPSTRRIPSKATGTRGPRCRRRSRRAASPGVRRPGRWAPGPGGGSAGGIPGAGSPPRCAGSGTTISPPPGLDQAAEAAQVLVGGEGGGHGANLRTASRASARSASPPGGRGRLPGPAARFLSRPESGATMRRAGFIHS
jgi:hypothetical protein